MGIFLMGWGLITRGSFGLFSVCCIAIIFKRVGFVVFL